MGSALIDKLSHSLWEPAVFPIPVLGASIAQQIPENCNTTGQQQKQPKVGRALPLWLAIQYHIQYEQWLSKALYEPSVCFKNVLKLIYMLLSSPIRKLYFHPGYVN